MLPDDDIRLDSPVYSALTGAQSQFADISGNAVRYQADVAPFLALPPDASAGDWADAAHLVAPGSYAAVQRNWVDTPPGWTVLREFDVVQMVQDDVSGSEDPEAITLGYRRARDARARPRNRARAVPEADDRPGSTSSDYDTARR